MLRVLSHPSWPLPSVDPKTLSLILYAHTAGIPIAIDRNTLHAYFERSSSNLTNDTKDDFVHTGASIFDDLKTEFDIDASISTENLLEFSALSTFASSKLQDAIWFSFLCSSDSRRPMLKFFGDALSFYGRLVWMYSGKMERDIIERLKILYPNASFPILEDRQSASDKEEEMKKEGKARIPTYDLSHPILVDAKNGYRAFSHLIQQSSTPFLFNNSTMTSLDCQLVAHLAIVLDSNLRICLKTIIELEFPELITYYHRHKQNLFVDDRWVIEVDEIETERSLKGIVNDIWSWIKSGKKKKEEDAELALFRKSRNWAVGAALMFFTGFIFQQGLIQIEVDSEEEDDDDDKEYGYVEEPKMEFGEKEDE